MTFILTNSLRVEPLHNFLTKIHKFMAKIKLVQHPLQIFRRSEKVNVEVTSDRSRFVTVIDLIDITSEGYT